MTSTPYKILKALAPALLLTLGVVSCKKDTDTENYELVRNFMPGDISVAAGDTIATLSWRASLYTTGKDLSYTLDISKDSLFQGTPDYSITTKSTSITISERNLTVRQKYYARLKANSLGASEESKWVYSGGIIPLKGEQVFLPVLDGEVTESTATLRWRLVYPISKITLTTSTGTKTEVTITGTESAAGKKTITGLTPKTKYTAVIYSGTLIKGEYSFTTFADIPTGADVVMVQATDNLAAMIAAATTNTTFVLMQGTKYLSGSTVNIPNNVSITVWGQSGPNRPVIAFSLVNLPTTGGTIRFENVDITGYPDGVTGTPRSYFINQSAASSVPELTFENCIFRNMAYTPLRLQGNPVSVEKLTVNNCIARDCGFSGSTGTYAFISSTVTTAKFNNIVVTNNTFYNIGYGLIVHNAVAPNSIQVDNNSFYNVTGDTRYMFDFKALVPASFTFINNIIGKTVGSSSAKGYQSGTPPTVGTNTYKTSDALFSANPFSGVIDYPKASTDLFTDPGTGNLLVKDLTFPGRSISGDPRWRY
jgi:hypothetical protein